MCHPVYCFLGKSASSFGGGVPAAFFVARIANSSSQILNAIRTTRNCPVPTLWECGGSPPLFFRPHVEV